ncbi:MAG: AI-2E family transporter [Lachnospiraceae bacterium]|nr:AI-2E family transporter [Lachnospiraceae bacterium]MDD7027125.1 AI-2E family transporter [Lachnospiraceae bacterium]MDY5700164.1 AI-2E family transporter [Lachnospiraceae bacterium]
MKFRWDKKYLYWGLTAFVVLVGCIGVIYFLFNGSILKYNVKKIIKILMPIIDGLIIAYLLAPLVNIIEKKLLFPLYEKTKIEIDKKLMNRTRIYSISLTFLLVISLLYSFIQFVIPQVYESIVSIVGQLPTYYNNLITDLDTLFRQNPEMEAYVVNLFNRFSNLNQDLLKGINSVVQTLSQSVISLFREVLNLVVGFIISIYLLFSKERFIAQSKKIIYACFERHTANSIISDFKMINRTFGGFISGKILDSIIIGILCYICINIIGTPYSLLISVIVGVTNIIPYFGPFIGAIPSAILILMVDPIQCLYFVIFIFILQQFDGNILGPKILGNSIGISAFWIIFSVTVFGGLLGVLGMVIGVPVFAVIYNLFNRYIRKRLKRKGYPVETESYKDIVKIDEQNCIIKDTTIR